MPNSTSIPAIRERDHLLTLNAPRTLRPQTQEYVDYLRSAALRALRGLLPDGPSETRLWAVFLKLGARDPELAARLGVAPIGGGPDPGAPAALWAGHRGRVLDNLRRALKPAKSASTSAAVGDRLNKDPWKRLTFDIVKVKCHDPQDPALRGNADELHITNNWDWKGANGSHNDGVHSSFFDDVAKTDEVYPKAADVTFVAAFKQPKAFPCRFGALVVLMEEDNGKLVGDLGEILDIVEGELGGATADDDGDVPWYIEVIEAIAGWVLNGMRDDILGAFRTEVTLSHPKAMFPTTGKPTSGTKSATISGPKYRYSVDYRWTLS